MKFISYIKLLVLGTFCLAANAQTFEVDPANNKDTINFIDILGKKQGRWIIWGKTKPNTCYQPNSKVEEGKYADNKKLGIWKEYFCNGIVKSKITFQNGRPDGYAIMYYENGKIAEEGTWKGTKWVGNYKLYYDNGHVQNEFTFNPNGKREGEQKYFYETGQLMIEGNWANGKEAGKIMEYHENGELKSEKNYANGEVDLTSIKVYQPNKPNKKVSDELDKNKKAIAKQDELASVSETKKSNGILNGHHVLYYKNRLKSKDGVFRDNYLIDGKSYVYDTNGILLRIEIYKDGRYAGDAQIDE